MDLTTWLFLLVEIHHILEEGVDGIERYQINSTSQAISWKIKVKVVMYRFKMYGEAIHTCLGHYLSSIKKKSTLL